MVAESQVRWDDVRLFLALIRGATLAQAGTRLGLDTSTMSRRLVALEKSVGHRLFERTRTGLVATHWAERVRAGAESMEAGFAQLSRDLSGVSTEPRGVVRLSAAPGLMDTFVVPGLSRLRAKAPGLVLELDASTRVLDLTRHEADIALRSVPPQGAELLVRKLMHGHWVVAGAPSLLKSLGRLQRWDAAAWIVWDRDMASLAPARWVTQHVPRAEIAVRTSHMASQLRAAELGLGLVLLPEPYLAPYGLQAARTAPALAKSVAALPEQDLWIVGHRALRDLPRVAVVWDHLVRELSTRRQLGASSGAGKGNRD